MKTVYLLKLHERSIKYLELYDYNMALMDNTKEMLRTYEKADSLSTLRLFTTDTEIKEKIEHRLQLSQFILDRYYKTIYKIIAEIQ